MPNQNDTYLELVAVNGECTCASGDMCVEPGDVGPGDVGYCQLCAVLDPYWPCPTLDENDYPREPIQGGHR